jgi:hypothetical protein
MQRVQHWGWGGYMKYIPSHRQSTSLFALTAQSEKEAKYKVILDDSIILIPSIFYICHKNIRRNL